MNNNNTTYHPLGDYIRPVDVRNKDLKVTTLVGLTIEKCFIPSVANIIGTDLSNYKVIKHGQFACSLMQVSRDGKIPVAMFTEEEAIMSPAYPMFEIASDNLLPEYLMMWFSRPEFDREASYYAVGGVRGSLTWEDFCAMRIPVPPITEQRAVVADYEAVARRIAVAKRTIATLQATAQTLYRKMFVDGIDKEIPMGNIVRPKKGKNIVREDCIIGKIPVIAGGKTPSCYHNASNTDSPVITISASGANAGYIQIHKEKVWAADCSYIDRTIYPYIYYCYSILKANQDKIFSMQEGTGQPHIYPEHIMQLLIPDADIDTIKEYNINAEKLFSSVFIAKEEINKLTEIQSLLLARMGK